MTAALLLVAALAAAPAPVVTGMDHIPVVVADLAKAESAYRALGFAIKPGRAHDAGIRNVHVKFPDGTELELITAPAAVDPLTREYRRRLSAGDGPVFHGLYAPDLAKLVARLKALHRGFEPDDGLVGFAEGDPLHSLFFGGRQRSPTDRPEHFAHANGATGLIGVWLRGADPEARLLVQLGARAAGPRPCGPMGDARALALQAGEVLLLAGPARSDDRKVVGAVVRVRSLAQTRRYLALTGRSRDGGSSRMRSPQPLARPRERPWSLA